MAGQQLPLRYRLGQPMLARRTSHYAHQLSFRLQHTVNKGQAGVLAYYQSAMATRPVRYVPV